MIEIDAVNNAPTGSGHQTLQFSSAGYFQNRKDITVHCERGDQFSIRARQCELTIGGRGQ